MISLLMALSFLLGFGINTASAAPCPVVVIGDSNSEIAASMFGDKTYYAIGGYRAQDAAYDDKLLAFLNAQNNRIVFVKLGTNDIYNVHGFEAHAEKLIERILASGNAPVLVQVPNNTDAQVQVDRMNGILLSLAGKRHLKFVYYESRDEDGFHLNVEAQRRVNAAIDEAAGELCR